ncbi:MAG TPA: MBL fold metallo-hydrolase [Bacteroidia bacterium]|nr:MBL fold metallo-hydrolase [Bacteroidia bacterium]
MLYIKTFCFNAFQQNSYLLYTEAGEAVLIDAGNSNNAENQTLKQFVEDKQLNLKHLLLTHAHIDHVLGNRFVYDTWKLLPQVHEADLFLVQAMEKTAAIYGLNCEPSPLPEKYLQDGQVIQLGNYRLECIHTPGHSPGSIAFYNPQNKLLISGDVLFRESIGRTDLPKGDHATLLSSIRDKLFSLGDEVKVYCGHGPSTTLAHEKTHNPFLH